MAKHTLENKWKEYYDNLPDDKKAEVRERVMKEIACNQTAFYERLKTPNKLLSPADKKAIALICMVPVTFLFPELQPQRA